MKVTPIPENVLTGSVALLKFYCPDLDPVRLVKALASYEPANVEQVSKKDSLPLFVDKYKAADSLDLSPFTIIKMCKSGRLPAQKIGSQWRIRVEAIQALTRNQAPPTSD